VSGDVIVTVTLNAALHVAYATGKAADDILDDRGAVSGPNLHVDQRPLLRERANQLGQHVMHDDRQGRYDHLSSLLGRNVAIYQRKQTTQQEVVQAITAGVPTKVSGIPSTDPGAV